MEIANEEQARFWSELAPTWVELDEKLELVGGGPGRAAMELLAPVPGQHLLDIGCGGGGTTLELARRVAPDGDVVGVDIAEGMVSGARRRADKVGAHNVELLTADVQVHDLGAERFDGAFSRFGVMFFSGPAAAFTNVRRSLCPGGRLAFSCWRDLFDNEWMLVAGAAAIAVIGQPLPMPGPGEPGPFSLADAGRVRDVLGSAGFHDLEIEQYDEPVLLSEGAIAEQALISMRVGGVREALRDADDELRAKVLDAIDAALRERLDDGTVRLSRGAWLVTALA